MKKSILSIVAIATFSISTFAQIPNAGFETWTSMGTYNNPDGWATMNDVTAGSSVFTAEKGTPGSPGTSYLSLTSKTMGSAVMNGIAVSGTFDPVTMQPTSGFAFNGQPASLTGKWQHMIYGTSQGSITATLTRWDAGTNSRVVVATANKTLTGMAMSWANFTIPFVYTDANAPDSCVIVMKASGSNPTDQDYLWVDNLAFTGSLAGIQENATIHDLQLFPNPSSETLSISLEALKSENGTIELLNSIGQVVQTKSVVFSEGKSTIELPVGDLAKGTYFVKISTATAVQTRTVILK
jgi:hypothetical protein